MAKNTNKITIQNGTRYWTRTVRQIRFVGGVSRYVGEIKIKNTILHVEKQGEIWIVSPCSEHTKIPR